ncbi:hypothetical protein CC1G_10132 [Coprinopsis cinerea okayama7|uniref:Uncharacterized protein n=1 Tax=Coprinopsis cinerea (strain Okayama-7 / 130 / ATCC MYA-4618 / FGSC 9003) TaxID=240176 RepID=A8N3Z3_COPC7|nr:hypothetical protein CC1G_10132 [Coprinopsis cinerea okayama7\|eukprot:XP_001829602.2 hypothetical protein CC1G_10132 [Coprinopsis cinerea okayama7\
MPWPTPGNSSATRNLSAVGWQGLLDYLSSRLRAAGRDYTIQHPKLAQSERQQFLEALFSEIKISTFALATANIKFPNRIVIPRCFGQIFHLFYESEFAAIDPLLIHIVAEAGEGERDPILSHYVGAWWLPGEERKKYSLSDLVAMWHDQSAIMTRSLPEPPATSLVLSELTLESLREARSLLLASIEIVDQEIATNRVARKRVKTTMQTLSQEEAMWKRTLKEDPGECEFDDTTVLPPLPRPVDKDDWKKFHFYVLDRVCVAIKKASQTPIPRERQQGFYNRLYTEFLVGTLAYGISLAYFGNPFLPQGSLGIIHEWFETDQLSPRCLFERKVPSEMLTMNELHQPSWLDKDDIAYGEDVDPVPEIYAEWLQSLDQLHPISNLSLEELLHLRQKIVIHARQLGELRYDHLARAQELKDRIFRCWAITYRWGKPWKTAAFKSTSSEV